LKKAVKTFNKKPRAARFFIADEQNRGWAKKAKEGKNEGKRGTAARRAYIGYKQRLSKRRFYHSFNPSILFGLTVIK
jgi:hypothetical protein